MNVTQMRSNIFSRWYKEHTFPGNQKWSFFVPYRKHTTFHFLLCCLKIIRLGHYVYTYQISHVFMEWEILLPPLIIRLTESNSFCLAFENEIQYYHLENLRVTTYYVKISKLEIVHIFYWYVQQFNQFI